MFSGGVFSGPGVIDDRPTNVQTLISKISNGDISATGHPIHFMFGSRVGFSGTANLTESFKFTRRMTPVAMATNFDSKWSITQMV